MYNLGEVEGWAYTLPSRNLFIDRQDIDGSS
ncbi:hypothetical protein SNOG_11971 [Parastagonospora nodorum SN15]|uniref:Uncharacterized protein n=1 Tax=Phaeosphaeria nodorum (strain SN15 / ATCC MYA-4574 / FGSC 10173) TaxID=321614 RepID=Q0U8E3_PHANO|nr:hypothetical protein SNOG_11971 [Parastagonospora nodorum SN15]EAT80383.1 hypothetical protein SNOG_11971 [Parastagonospora nodorum SN15]